MDEKFEAAINDPENPVQDVNTSGREVMSMLLDPSMVNLESPFVPGDAENVLLYVHELREFLEGERGAVLSEDPHITVQNTNASSVYRITVDERPVESMPGQANDVLEALRAAIEEEDIDPILDIYEDIIDSQVRREVVQKLQEALPNIDEDRIEETNRGWLIDRFYVVDWTASVYVVTDDPDEDDYEIRGGGVGKTDRDHEFVELVPDSAPERQRVKFGDETVLVGEREMMFLSKVEWLLDRTKYHPDESFWRYNEKLRKEYIRRKN